MYSPDQANIDPRNPANYPDNAKSVYFICPNQFEDCETPDEAIDSWLGDEAKAISDAKRIAKVASHRVLVEEYIAHEDGTHEFVGSVTIFPWNA